MTYRGNFRVDTGDVFFNAKDDTMAFGRISSNGRNMGFRVELKNEDNTLVVTSDQLENEIRVPFSDYESGNIDSSTLSEVAEYFDCEEDDASSFILDCFDELYTEKVNHTKEMDDYRARKNKWGGYSDF